MFGFEVQATRENAQPEIVQFQSGSRTLGGEIFVPKGKGPFSAVLYNHGSSPGMLNSQASKSIGPLFAEKGWLFVMPYRRGQGLSEKAGAYIGVRINNKHSVISDEQHSLPEVSNWKRFVLRRRDCCVHTPTTIDSREKN